MWESPWFLMQLSGQHKTSVSHRDVSCDSQSGTSSQLFSQPYPHRNHPTLPALATTVPQLKSSNYKQFSERCITLGSQCSVIVNRDKKGARLDR